MSSPPTHRHCLPGVLSLRNSSFNSAEDAARQYFSDQTQLPAPAVQSTSALFFPADDGTDCDQPMEDNESSKASRSDVSSNESGSDNESNESGSDDEYNVDGRPLHFWKMPLTRHSPLIDEIVQELLPKVNEEREKYYKFFRDNCLDHESEFTAKLNRLNAQEMAELKRLPVLQAADMRKRVERWTLFLQDILDFMIPRRPGSYFFACPCGSHNFKRIEDLLVHIAKKARDDTFIYFKNEIDHWYENDIAEQEVAFIQHYSMMRILYKQRASCSHPLH